MNDGHQFPEVGLSFDPEFVSTTPTAEPARPLVQRRGFDLLALIEALPSLGTVLWLERREWRQLPLSAGATAQGVLVLEHPALALLNRCGGASAHTEVGPNGPREWLCLRDDVGTVLGKIYSLPDTDYLAWDEMIAGSHIPAAAPSVDRRQPHRAFRRCALACLGRRWRARVLTLELQQQPWLRCLRACAPLRMSLLGMELVADIVRSEGAEWISVLQES